MKTISIIPFVLLISTTLLGQVKKNIITGSTRAVIQDGNNNTVNFNLNASMDDLYKILEQQKKDVKVYEIDVHIDNISSFITKLEGHLEDLDSKLEEIKKEDKELYIKGKTNITKARIAIKEIKNYKENFSIKDTLDNLGRCKYYIVKNNNIKLNNSYYTFISDFNEGVAIVKYYNKYGYVDYNGVEVIRPQYDEVEIFQDGVALVKRKDLKQVLIIDKAGNTLHDLSAYSNVEKVKNHNLFIVKKGLQYGIINHKNETLVKPLYENITPSNYARQFIITEVEYPYNKGVINERGDIIIKTEYDKILPYNKKYYPVRNNYKWGLIDETGELTIGFIYDKISSFKHGYAKVKFNEKWGLIDYNGIQYLDIEFDEIISWTSEEVKVLYKNFNRITFNTKGDCVEYCNLYSQLRKGKKLYGDVTSFDQKSIEISLFETPFLLDIKTWKIQQEELYSNLLQRIDEGCRLSRKEEIQDTTVYVVNIREKYNHPNWCVLNEKGEYLIHFSDYYREIGSFNNEGYAKARNREGEIITIDKYGNQKASEKQAIEKAEQKQRIKSKANDALAKMVDRYRYFAIGGDLNLWARSYEFNLKMTRPDWYFSYEIGLTRNDIIKQHYTSFTGDFSLNNLFIYNIGVGTYYKGFDLHIGWISSEGELIDKATNDIFDIATSGGYLSLSYDWILFRFNSDMLAFSLSPYISISYETESNTNLYQSNSTTFPIPSTLDYLEDVNYSFNPIQFAWGIRLSLLFDEGE